MHVPSVHVALRRQREEIRDEPLEDVAAVRERDRGLRVGVAAGVRLWVDRRRVAREEVAEVELERAVVRVRGFERGRDAQARGDGTDAVRFSSVYVASFVVLVLETFLSPAQI